MLSLIRHRQLWLAKNQKQMLCEKEIRTNHQQHTAEAPIYLEGMLSGPTPWQVKEGNIQVLFFKASVSSSIDSGRTGRRRCRKRWMCRRSWWGR